MVNALSHLHLSHPQMGCVSLLAVVALLVGDNEFNDEALLEESTIEDFLLHCELDLDTAGVRLGPDEAGVDQLDALETLHQLEADGEELG